MPAFDDYLAANPDARDAWAQLQAVLADAGLEGLYEFAKNNLIEGRSAPEIQLRIRTEPLWKQRFKAIEVRKEKGLPPISEADVLEYERTATQMYRSVGLPQGFYDSPEDFAELMVADVSAQELQSRVMDGFVKSQQAPPEYRAEIQRLYGNVGPGGFAAYWLDPDKALPILEREAAAAGASFQAKATGFQRELSKEQAEFLASHGITQDQAKDVFGELAANNEIWGNMPGEINAEIDTDTILKGAFTNEEAAIERIRRRKAAKSGEFTEGGGFATGRGGVEGLATRKV